MLSILRKECKKKTQSEQTKRGRGRGVKEAMKKKKITNEITKWNTNALGAGGENYKTQRANSHIRNQGFREQIGVNKRRGRPRGREVRGGGQGWGRGGGGER